MAHMRNIESKEPYIPHAVLLLDVCRKKPDSFIPLSDVQETFSWSFRSAFAAVIRARKLLTGDALYTISGEGGIVYEPERMPVGRRISPIGLRPDPKWLSEIPRHHDMQNLLHCLRFATVVSNAEAVPLLTYDEHVVFMQLVANYPQNHVTTIPELSRALKKSNEYISNLLSSTMKKVTRETQGEWALAKERRGGMCYMLQHDNLHQ